MMTWLGKLHFHSFSTENHYWYKQKNIGKLLGVTYYIFNAVSKSKISVKIWCLKGILFFFVEPACGERDSCYNFSLVYAHAWVHCAWMHVSIWICPGHNFYIYT